MLKMRQHVQRHDLPRNHHERVQLHSAGMPPHAERKATARIRARMQLHQMRRQDLQMRDE